VSVRGAVPSRLAAVIGPVYALGLAAAVAAAASFATEPRDLATLAGIGGLLAAATLADRYPVPLDGIDTGGVSLLFVFCVATIVLYGWQAGVLVGAAPAALQLIQHRPPIRVLYNASVLAVAGAAAGIAVLLPLGGDDTARIAAAVLLVASVHYLVNLGLISLVVAVSTRKALVAVVRSSIRSTSLPFALMGSAALILVVLWQRSPWLSAALVGPLLAIALYQRSTHHALRAMRLALTDPLTGLGNHRHFHERLERELAGAQAEGRQLSLCLVDLDDFKQINDRHGHPTGDQVLAHIASKLRQGGEAYRLGGDEFALLFSGSEAEALLAAQSILARVSADDVDQVGSVTLSVGIATAAESPITRAELVRRADGALYWAKEYGKNQVRAWRPDVVELAELKRLVDGSDRAARYRAAASLARVVDARDAYTNGHSERVAELSARLAERLELDEEQVELTRLAGSLHDLGKLGIPEEILRKPGPLTQTERRTLERHPLIGYRMLESLEVDPVADWVLRHHERWDGGGYPSGMPAERIPLSARIIFVADAYDAMISERVYRARLTEEEALVELQRCSGTQFDPAVVAALAAELAESEAIAATEAIPA
jgi:diguanylate cyclase (GGDEF)-like protein